MTTVMHFINGKQVANSSSRTGNVFDPALGQVIHQVSLAETKDAQDAINAASAAFPAWRDTSLTKRQQIMFNFREILNAKKEELAAIVTEEHGKTLPDALGEVTRGLEVVEFATAMASHLKGSYSESGDYPIITPDGNEIYSGGKFGRPNTWRWSKDKVQWGIENGYIVFKKNKDNWKVYIKQYQFVDN